MPTYSDGRDSTVTRTKRAALAAENRRLRTQVAALEDRLTALQAANETAYAATYDATGGGGHDIRRPFGADPVRQPSDRLLQRMTGPVA